MKLVTAGDEPRRPEDYDLMAWFDLSPMRPDEYGRTRARPWTEAMAARVAIQAGIDQAREEASGFAALNETEPGRVG